MSPESCQTKSALAALLGFVIIQFWLKVSLQQWPWERDKTWIRKGNHLSAVLFGGQAWLPGLALLLTLHPLVLSRSGDGSTLVLWHLEDVLIFCTHSACLFQAQLNMLFFLPKQQWIMTNCENQLDVFTSACENVACTLFSLLWWCSLQESSSNQWLHFPRWAQPQ